MNVVPRLALAFHSPKATEPIPYCGPAAHDLLIQATLDRRVVRITFLDRLPLVGRSVRVAAPLIELDDHAYAALIDGAHPERDPDIDAVRAAIAAAGHVARAIEADDVAREPLATTARVIWRQRHVGVEPGMRVGLLAALADEPPMTLHELCARVPGPRDPVFAVMALACACELHLDLAQGFDRNTIVRGES